MRLYNQLELGLLLSDNPIIVECGADHGLTTLQFLKDYPKAQLFCFEPDPRNAVNFRKATIDYIDRCILYEVAITDKDGFVEFHQSYGRSSKHPNREHVYSSTIKDPTPQMKIHSWLKYKSSIQVKAIRLDTWLKTTKINSVDFMWADVEGAEENLIFGGTETLKKLHYLYIEYNDNENYGGRITSNDILNLLPDYVLLYKWANDMLLCNLKWAENNV